MENYRFLSAMVSVLALSGFVASLPWLRRRLCWFHLLTAFVGGLITGTLVGILGSYMFTGFFNLDWPALKVFGYPQWMVLHLEVFSAAVLFLLCLLRFPNILTRDQEPVSSFSRFFLLSTAFSLAYGANFALSVHQPGYLFVVTIVGGVLPGLFGATLSYLFGRRLSLPKVALRQHGQSLLRLVLALLLLVTAVFLPFYNDSNGALAYGVSYQSEIGPVVYWPETMGNYLGLANYFREREDINAAIALSKQAVLVDSQSHPARIQLAALLMQAEQHETAIAHLDVALSLVPTDTNALYGRVLAYQSLEDYGSAIENLDQIIVLDPDSNFNYLARAGLHIYAGEYGRALADIGVLDEREAGCSTASLFEGIAYLGQHDGDQAQRALAEWSEYKLSESPTYTYGYTVMSALECNAIAMGWVGTPVYFNWRIDAYIPDWSDLYTASWPTPVSTPESPSVYAASLSFLHEPYTISFGNLLSRWFTAPTSALKYISPVLEDLADVGTSSDAVTAYLYLGQLYTSQNQHEDSLSYYQQAAELAANIGDIPAQRDALAGVAKSTDALEKIEAARHAYEQSIELALQQESEPDDLAEIYYKLALLNLDAGQFEDAIDNLSEALKLDPEHKDAIFTRAQAYFETAHFEEAVADAHYALQLDPDWVEARIALGHYLSVAGQYQQALETLLTIEEEANTRPLYYHYLGYAYVAQGERDQAISSYERSFLLIKAKSGSANKADLYSHIIDELRQLESLDPATGAIIEDIWVMMRTIIGVDAKQDASWARLYYVNVDSYGWVDAEDYEPTSLPASTEAVTPTEPVTEKLWVQLAAVGPPQIRPGSSDVVQIAAELRSHPNQEGTAFAIELYKDHEYVAEIHVDAVNFEVGGDESSTTPARSLDVGQPIRWQLAVSPKPGYEGEQVVLCTIVLSDKDDPDWSQEIPVGSLLITVPTRLGIPSKILYPLCGIAAVIGTAIALPLWNTLVKPRLKRRRGEGEEVFLPSPYSVYKEALQYLLARLKEHPDQYQAALVYQQRLEENIAQSQRHGDSDVRRAQRSEIIDGLNGVASSALDVSFSEICSRIADGRAQGSKAGGKKINE